MKLNLNSLLKDKNVLRIVAILSVFNLLGYLMVQNLDAVAFFVIIGFLTTYFSKNMIVVLLVAMIATNFLVMSRNAARKNTVEGMENPKESGRDKTKSVPDKKPAPPKKLSGPKPDDESEGEQIATGSPSKLDEAGTVEAAYENLENMLDAEGISQMTSNTKELAEKQKALGKMVEQMQPMMTNVNNMLSQMGGMEGMQKMMDNVTPMITGLSKITSSMAGGKKGGESDLEGFQLMK